MNNQYNKDGKKEGLWVKIYDNGVVQEERNYVNGVREGIIKLEIYMVNIKHSIVMVN